MVACMKQVVYCGNNTASRIDGCRAPGPRTRGAMAPTAYHPSSVARPVTRTSSCGDPSTPGNQSNTSVITTNNHNNNSNTRTSYTNPPPTAIPSPPATASPTSVPMINTTTTTTYTLRSNGMGGSTSLLSVSSTDGAAGLPSSNTQRPGTPQYCNNTNNPITHNPHNVVMPSKCSDP